MAQENKGQAKACPFHVAHPAAQTCLTNTCDTSGRCDLESRFLPRRTVHVHSVLHEAQAQASNTLAQKARVASAGDDRVPRTGVGGSAPPQKAAHRTPPEARLVRALVPDFLVLPVD